MQTSPYLFFGTCCEEALAFYERIGLGRTTEVVRYGEYDIPVRTQAMIGRIQHACFEGPGVRLYASDNDDAEPMKGSAILIESADRARMIALFKQLRDGGTASIPFGPSKWGSWFGIVVDRFGVQWMLDSPD